MARAVTAPEISAARHALSAAQHPMDPQDYLQPDFDPSSLTVPKLRNVLLIEDVDYPQSAKKAVLVDLFNQHITPKAARLRDIRTRVHASAHGMVDAAPPRDDFDPSSARRHTASRKSARGAVDTTEDGEEQDRTRTRRKSIVRGRTSELEMPYAEKGPVKSTCSPRKSASRKSTLPKAKPFVSDEDTEGSTDGVFSNYNPFQSGSPPAPSEKDRRKVDYSRRCFIRCTTDACRLSQCLYQKSEDLRFLNAGLTLARRS